MHKCVCTCVTEMERDRETSEHEDLAPGSNHKKEQNGQRTGARVTPRIFAFFCSRSFMTPLGGKKRKAGVLMICRRVETRDKKEKVRERQTQRTSPCPKPFPEPETFTEGPTQAFSLCVLPSYTGASTFTFPWKGLECILQKALDSYLKSEGFKQYVEKAVGSEPRAGSYTDQENDEGTHRIHYIL